MPWEKSFDEQAALDDAMQVFWQKGYEGTSISELLTRTGLGKGSLYNAFGGKRELFLRALNRYDVEHRRAMLSQLEALDQPVRAMGMFLDGMVEETVSDEKRRGCFMINTALEVGAHEPQVSEVVSRGLQEIEAFFRRCIEVGQARSEISAVLDAGATAKTLLSLCVAIRVLGRGVFKVQALRTIAEQGKQLIASPAVGSPG